MKTLITGGAGFIGSHLSEKLLELGEEVIVLDNLATGAKENLAKILSHPKFRFVKGDVLDEKLVSELVGEVGQIYHLAAVVGVKRVVEEPLRTLEVNLQGTENVLKAAAQKSKKVFIASSSEVYGKNQKLPFSEKDECLYGPTEDLRWIYPLSKAVDEQLAFAYFHEKKLPVIVVRFFNVAGPRQSAAYGMVIPNFVRSALSGQPLTVFGRGFQTRCFVHVGDVVDLIIDLMKTKKTEGRLFNVGGEEKISIKNLAQKVLELTQSRSKIVYVPFAKTYSPTSEVFLERQPSLSRLKEIGISRKIKTLDEILIDVIIDYYQRRK